MKKGNPREVFCYLLFLDIVKYSTLSAQQQVTAATQLSEVLLALGIFRKYQKHAIILPTGDGFGIVFHSGEALCRVPLQVAIALQREVKKRLLDIPFRVGIHCGENSLIVDVNGNVNVAGSAINYAARVMALGDANHILISKEYYVTCVLGNPEYEALCHIAGEYPVKHRTKIVIYNVNLQGDFGNPGSPKVPMNDTEKKERSKDKAKPVFTPDELFQTPMAEFSENNVDNIKHKVMTSLLELFKIEALNEQRQRFWLAFFMISIDDYEEAKNLLERFCQIEQRSADGQYYLAVCYNKIGKMAKALNHLEKSILLNGANRSKARVDLNFKLLWNNKTFNSMTS